MTYKILIKKNTSVPSYTFYQTSVNGAESADYSTENLDELEATYKALLKTQPSESMIPVHMLDPELTIQIAEA